MECYEIAVDIYLYIYCLECYLARRPNTNQTPTKVRAENKRGAQETKGYVDRLNELLFSFSLWF